MPELHDRYLKKYSKLKSFIWKSGTPETCKLALAASLRVGFCDEWKRGPNHRIILSIYGSTVFDLVFY